MTEMVQKILQTRETMQNLLQMTEMVQTKLQTMETVHKNLQVREMLIKILLKCNTGQYLN